jgi:hypothetical protein
MSTQHTIQYISTALFVEEKTEALFHLRLSRDIILLPAVTFYFVK